MICVLDMEDVGKVVNNGFAQVLHGSFYNQKVDVFSFAVVFWEVFMYMPITATIPGQGAPLLKLGTQRVSCTNAY